MNALPFDIIAEILSYRDVIPSNRLSRLSWQGPWFRKKTMMQPLLLAPCLVSKAWNEAATHLLYRDVFLADLRALEVFVDTLERREDLREYVQSVSFSRACSAEAECWLELGSSPELKLLYSICPNLYSRTITARTVHTPDSDSGNGQPVTTTTTTEFPGWEQLSFASLTRLELRTTGDLPVTFSSQLFLPVLEDVTIQGWKATAREKEVRSRWPQMPRLRRLCLIHCDVSSSTLGIDGFFRSDRPQWGLRAVEIIGANRRKELDNLLSSILLTAPNVEMLTYFPSSYGYAFKPCFFDSVFSIRIGIEYLRWIVPHYGLPRHLLHLVLVDVRREVHLSRFQNFLLEIAELRCFRSGYNRLKTVQVSTQHDENSWVGCKKISRTFKRFGVKFFLTKLEGYELPYLGAHNEIL